MHPRVHGFDSSPKLEILVIYFKTKETEFTDGR